MGKKKKHMPPPEVSEAKREADELFDAYHGASPWTKGLLWIVALLLVVVFALSWLLVMRGYANERQAAVLDHRTIRLQGVWDRFTFVWDRLGNDTLTVEEIEWLGDPLLRGEP